jgi:hypothetical protein
MNSKHLFCLCVCGLLAYTSSAQFSGQYNALNITGTTNTWKTEIPLGAPATTGSSYLNEEWQQGEIILKDGKNAGSFPVRVQLEHAVVEIKVENKPRTLNFSNVRHILLHDKAVGLPGAVCMGNQLTFEDRPLKGVAVIHDVEGSSFKIINNYFIELLPSNYNVALDVGSKDNQKLTKQKTFVQKDGLLTEVKGSNKKIVKMLGYEKLKAWTALNSNNFDLKDPKDLMNFLRMMK